MYHILKSRSTEEIHSVNLCKWPIWAYNAGLGRETSTWSSPSLSSREVLKPFICRFLIPAVRMCCWETYEKEKALGPTNWHGEVRAWSQATVQSRTDKNVNSCLTLWELAFVCCYQFYSVVSHNCASAGNSDAKDPYLGCLKSVPRHSVASGSSSALTVRVLAAQVRCELQVTQLCCCISHMGLMSGFILLRGPTPRCGSDPTSCLRSAACQTQHMGQSWHGFRRHFVNSLEICKAPWHTLCFHSVHLLWRHQVASPGDQQINCGMGFLCLLLHRWEQSLRRVKSRGSSQITSRCSLQARKYRPHAGGFSNYHTWPDLTQVLYEMLEWEMAATTFSSFLWRGFSEYVKQSPPSAGRRVRPELWAAIVAAAASHMLLEACVCTAGSGCQAGWGGEDMLRTCSSMDEKGQGPGW